MLDLDNINVFYGGLQALWDVSFKVEKGEVVAIIGSNGAGKTTTLNTISGILHPKSGLIRFLGKRIDKLPPYRITEIGIVQVPEGRELFPHMTVLENLELGSYISRARKKKDDTLEWVFQLFPKLKERKDQVAGTLSGGEQQMLAIGRSLMSRPKLLMLDEPTLGLAPKLVLTVFNVIEELHKEELTILLVEQHVHHALKLADRAYLLENGHVTLHGTGKSLLNYDNVKKRYLGM